MYERFISLLGPLLVSEEYVEKAQIYHKYSLMLFEEMRYRFFLL
jgi:hypothetical protein